MNLTEQRDQKWLYFLKILTAWCRALIFPAFLMSSIGFVYAAYTYSQDPYIYREMPVIMVYCNELDMTRRERIQFMKNPDQVISRCQERVVWAGGDSQAVRGLVKQKADNILNSLFSNPSNPKITRSEASKALEYFEDGSSSYLLFKDQAAKAISLSRKKLATDFKMKNHYLRPVFDEKTRRDNWVAKFEGIWIIGSEKQAGKKVKLFIVFEPVFNAVRNSSGQAVMVKEMEIIINE